MVSGEITGEFTAEFDWAMPYPEVLRLLGIDTPEGARVMVTGLPGEADGVYTVERLDDDTYTLTPAPEATP